MLYYCTDSSCCCMSLHHISQKCTKPVRYYSTQLALPSALLYTAATYNHTLNYTHIQRRIIHTALIMSSSSNSKPKSRTRSYQTSLLDHVSTDKNHVSPSTSISK